MSKGLFDDQRAIRDFAFTDTWDPTTDHRADDWLGAEWKVFDETYGYRVYRCVKNTSASSIAANRVVATEAGETNLDHVELGAAGDPKPRVRGVTIGAIAVGYMGWVVARGKVVGEAVTTDVTADTGITTDANGLVKDGTIGTHAIVGSSLATIDVSVLATGTIYIDVL